MINQLRNRKFSTHSDTGTIRWYTYKLNIRVQKIICPRTTFNSWSEEPCRTPGLRDTYLNDFTPSHHETFRPLMNPATEFQRAQFTKPVIPFFAITDLKGRFRPVAQNCRGPTAEAVYNFIPSSWCQL